MKYSKTWNVVAISRNYVCIFLIEVVLDPQQSRSDVHRRSSSMAAIVYGVENLRKRARWGAIRGNAGGKWPRRMRSEPDWPFKSDNLAKILIITGQFSTETNAIILLLLSRGFTKFSISLPNSFKNSLKPMVKVTLIINHSTN